MLPPPQPLGIDFVLLFLRRLFLCLLLLFFFFVYGVLYDSVSTYSFFLSNYIGSSVPDTGIELGHALARKRLPLRL
jgi:hypothetical protein